MIGALISLDTTGTTQNPLMKANCLRCKNQASNKKRTTAFEVWKSEYSGVTKIRYQEDILMDQVVILLAPSGRKPFSHKLS